MSFFFWHPAPSRIPSRILLHPPVLSAAYGATRIIPTTLALARYPATVLGTNSGVWYFQDLRRLPIVSSVLYDPLLRLQGSTAPNRRQKTAFLVQIWQRFWLLWPDFALRYASGLAPHLRQLSAVLEHR